MDIVFLSKLLGVFALSAVIFWAGIPAGFAIGLSPFLSALVTGSGAFASVLLVVFAGVGLRIWITKLRQGKTSAVLAIDPPLSPKPEPKPNFFRKIWNRYGLIGLALTAPLLSGTLAGAALAVALGSKRGPILIWFAVGIILWAAVIVTAVTLGVNFTKH